MLPSSRAEFSLKRLSYFPEPALITSVITLDPDHRMKLSEGGGQLFERFGECGGMIRIDTRVA
jgi:hypothetical protein